MAGSTRRIALAVSAAIRPYSPAVLWPICQSPSISLPRHHTRTSCGSAAPFFTRRSDQYVPPGWLQYSTSRAAASGPLVPRFTASIGSEPTRRVQAQNSSVPTAFGSMERQARSSRVGRSSTGPMPSSQR